MFDPEKPKLAEFVDRNNTAAPETLLLAGYLDKNLTITGIEEIIYNAAAPPFLIYGAGTFYFALDFRAWTTFTEEILMPRMLFYDVNNVLALQCNSGTPVYDDIAAIVKFSGLEFKLKNIAFGRIQNTHFNYFSFIGYKITVNL